VGVNVCSTGGGDARRFRMVREFFFFFGDRNSAANTFGRAFAGAKTLGTDFRVREL
jgi:hypothetical protein